MDLPDEEFLELEFAAKAAGNAPTGVSYLALLRLGQWNPREDDGDALRLMASLQLCVAFIGMAVQVRLSTGGPLVTEVVYRGEPWVAALRRAITRAAAGIGRAMP